MKHVTKQLYITFSVNGVERTSSDQCTTYDTWQNFGQIRPADHIAQTFVNSACSWMRCRPRDITVSKIEARSVNQGRKILASVEG